MWILLGLVSSLFLGVYDISKKWSLNENAVIPVLFFATFSGMMIFLPILVISTLVPEFSSAYTWYIPQQQSIAHMHFFIKSIIVGTSWIMAYFALKNLPITIVTPIRASSPLWTLIGAVILFDEQFTMLQWAGIMVTLTFYYIFALAGKNEGIHFYRNKWIYLIVLATIIGAASSLYDKYLIAKYDRLAMQAWFSVYLVVYYIPIFLLLWYPGRKSTTPFKWRHSIFLVGLFLVIADFAYFYALSYADSLIAIIASLRRSSVIISFLLGAAIFGDRNLRKKWHALLGILLGILLIYWGSYN